jgi:uncharacterized protein YjbI with pentapeptide repeats
MKSYKSITLTVNELEDKDQSGSSFKNVTFDGVDFKGYNFSYALFDGCKWKKKAINCNFTAAEGNSLPAENERSGCNMFRGPTVVGTRADYLKSL